VADGLLAVLLHPCCVACDAPLDTPTSGPVCEHCWNGVVPVPTPICSRCGVPLASWRQHAQTSGRCARCRRAPGHLSLLRSAGVHEGRLRDIIHAFKYRGHRSLAAPLARLLRHAAAAAFDGADGVVPVPLHGRRERERGFNQSADLARRLGLPVLDVLQRTRDTASQAGLRAAARRSNVRGAFAPRRRARWGFGFLASGFSTGVLSGLALPWPDRTCESGVRRADGVRGRTLVLVDDVCTTAATLEACAEVLLGLGAREVRAATVARAVR